MERTISWRKIHVRDWELLALVALAWLFLLTLISVLTTWQYGFHRDELNFIENARRLAWGYVEYPPFTPFIARVVLELAGASLIALRFTAALGISISMVLTGMMAQELGGTGQAQIVAMLAAGIAPIVLVNSRFFSYQTFDYLWWVLVSYLMIRRLKSGNPRGWLGIGAAVGFGMMTKYSIPFLLAGIAIGVLLTSARRDLKSPWLWAGASLALLIFSPNLIWQIQHHWISLEFQVSTRLYNIQVGRTGSFLLDQLYICANPAAITLWLGGLYFYLKDPAGKPYRAIGWMYLVPLVLFLLAKGRFYYLAGAYPMLIAAGASRAIRKPAAQTGPPASSRRRPTFWRNPLYGGLILGGLFGMAVILPVAPVGSAWWNFDAEMNPEIREEIGWPELVREVARIYAALPEEERSQAGILAKNYGEAGAVNLYGAAGGLPKAISGIDTYWLRGYGSPPPQTLIVLGMTEAEARSIFERCYLAGHTPNPENIQNEETRDHPNIFVCRTPRQPWPEFWESFRYFG